MSEDKCLSHSMSEEVIGRSFIRFYNKLRQNENVLSKDSDENCITELEKIDACISDEEIGFTEYNDEIIRYLVSSITVTEDMKIVITLKGGVKITEPIYV